MIDKINYLETEDGKYPMVFSLNVMESIQDKYGSIEKWSAIIQKDGEPNIKSLKFFMTEAINEGIEIENKKTGKKRRPLTPKQVGRVLTEVGLTAMADKIMNTVSESIKYRDKRYHKKALHFPRRIRRNN